MDYIVDVIARLRELARTLERMGNEDDAETLFQIAGDLTDHRVMELREAGQS